MSLPQPSQSPTSIAVSAPSPLTTTTGSLSLRDPRTNRGAVACVGSDFGECDIPARCPLLWRLILIGFRGVFSDRLDVHHRRPYKDWYYGIVASSREHQGTQNTPS